MNEQQWGVKYAQDIRQGDLLGAGTMALQVIDVQRKERAVLVRCYSDLYKQCTSLSSMAQNQLIPYALSGVKHGDLIINHWVTETREGEGA